MSEVVNSKEIAKLEQDASLDMTFVRQGAREMLRAVYLCGQRLAKCRDMFDRDVSLAKKVYGFDNFGQTCASPNGFSIGGSIGSRWASIAEQIDWHVENNDVPLDAFLKENNNGNALTWDKVYNLKPILELKKDKDFTAEWLNNAKEWGIYDLKSSVVEYKIQNGLAIEKKTPYKNPLDEELDWSIAWGMLKEAITQLRTTNNSITFDNLIELLNTIEEKVKKL